jgi:hypothetical protein
MPIFPKTGGTMNQQSVPTERQLPREHARRQIHSLRARGMTIRDIAIEAGKSRDYVFAMLNGQKRGEPSPIPPAANDNKVVRMMPHNGGCSSLSGRVPVSLPRVPTLELPEVGIEVAA